jgi:hypothetical protein
MYVSANEKVVSLNLHRYTTGFADVCAQNGWDVELTWRRLNGGEGGAWFAHVDSINPSYVYYNRADGCW